MSEIECALLKRAEQKGRQKGLLKSGEELDCKYTHICNGLRCLLLDEPQYMTIYLKQQEESTSYSSLDRFYNRLEKHFGNK